MQDNEPTLYLELSKRRQLSAAIELAQRVGIPKNGTIVDVACGPGSLCRYLAEQHRSCQVIGIDNSSEAIGHARSLVQAERHHQDAESSLRVMGSKECGPRIKYVLGDATTLPFQDASVDVVFATSSLHWFYPHQRRFICEVLRVLRGGGQLAIEWFTKTHPQHRNHVDALIGRALKTLSLERCAELFKPFGSRFLTAEQLNSLLVDCGFADVSIDAFEVDVTYTNGNEAVRHWHASFAKELCGWLPEEYRPQLLATIAQQIDDQRTKMGDGLYHMNGLRVLAIAMKDYDVP